MPCCFGNTVHKTYNAMYLQRSIVLQTTLSHSLQLTPALRYSAELRNSGLPARKLGLLSPPCAAFLEPLELGLGPPGAAPLLRLGCC